MHACMHRCSTPRPSTQGHTYLFHLLFETLKAMSLSFYISYRLIPTFMSRILEEPKLLTTPFSLGKLGRHGFVFPPLLDVNK